jgi:hypothetical protein
MRPGIVQIVGLSGAALVLAGCGFADIRSPVPEFMRLKEASPIPPEQPPDVRKLIRDKMDWMFPAASQPRNIRVSPPTHQARGPGWTACVRAEVVSATGKPIGTQTWRLSIEGGELVDRRRAEDDDNCQSESYEPV